MSRCIHIEGLASVRRESETLEPIHMERRILFPSHPGLSMLWASGLDMAGEDVIAELHEVAAWGIALGSVPLDR